MGKSFSRELAEWMAKVDKQLSNLSSGNRLDHASLDGTTLYLRDADGNLSGRLGRQPDGSNGVHVVKVQPPPQLTAPILTVGDQAGTCLVEWDGRTFDGRRMPLIHGHTEIWAELVGEDWSPTVAPGDAAKRVGTIRDRTGGEVVVALPQAGTWAVWLRAMGADRETAGPWSPVATVEIVPLVDTEAIEAELEDARDRITEADERLTAGQQALAVNLGDLNENRLPALEQDISNAVSEATANIQDFETRWDAQWDTTIPALAARQDTLEGEITDGLTQVHSQAEALAEAARDDAVNQAAANAQSEYDRLQEIAERALSRAGDNLIEDPSFETQHWVDEWDGLGGRLVRASGSPVRTGDRLLVVEDGTPVDLSFPDIDVELDQSYRMTIWYRTWPSNLADLSDGESALVFYDSDTGAELARSEPLTVGSTYRRAEVVYTVPEGVQSIRPAIRASWPAGQMLFDDVSVREVGAAAEALRQAELARQQAEAAHIAAGNAVDAAANAYDAASAKNSIHWSLSAPSGTADNTDDVWWQYELRNGRRVVIGQWFWDNGVWRETEIAEEWLPLVNIGTGTYGDLSGDRLTANTVKAGALAVMPDSADFAPGPGGFEDLWTVGSNNAIVTTSSDPSGAQLRVSPGGPAGNSTRTYGPWIKAQAGDTIYYKIYVGRTGSPDADLRIYFMYDGLVTSWDRVWEENATGWVEGVHTVRSDVESTVTLAFVASGGTQGHYWIRNMDVRKQVKGVMIEPQGIKSPQVDTVELTASDAFLDNAMVNLIQGRMANFDEALIGGTLLKDGAISASKLTIIPDTEDFAPNPGRDPELWDLLGASLVANSNNPSGVAFRLNQRSDDTQVRGPIRPVTAGQQVYFNGRYTYWGAQFGVTQNTNVRMEWYIDPNAGHTGWSTITTVPLGSSAGWYEGTVTVPDDAAYGRLYIYQASTSGGDAGFWGNIQCHPIAEGKLIVQGLLQATTAELQELFFDTAVGNAIWAEAVRSRLVESQGIITEDMIATGAVTTPKLTVTEEMVGEVAKLLRIEAGSLASNDIEAMRIVSSLIEATTYLIHNADGDVSVRLDGMDNYLAGRLHAGMDEDRGIELDYELIEVDDDTNGTDPGDGDESEATHQIVTPYLRFRTSHNHRQIPRMWVGTEGNLNLNPGRVGTSGQNATPFRIWGEAQANVIRAVRFTVPTSGVSGGMFRDGDRTRITGRAPDWSHQLGMFTPGSLGPYSPVSGQYRGTMTWSTPTPTGVRNPIVNGRMSSTSMDNWRSCTATTQVGSSSGFGFTLVSSSTSTNMWLDYNANWV